jgi:hypothetical protein
MWELQVGDMVYLRVSPTRGVKRFRVKGNLSHQYIGPFKILSQKGAVAYELELPTKLFQVHNVFHVSQLRKCLKVPEEPLSYTELELKPDFTYEEKPTKILEKSGNSLGIGQ